MRWLVFISCISLSACVNSAGLHPHAIAYDANSLSTPHTYPQSTTVSAISVQPVIVRWWLRFHDEDLNQLMDVALKDSPTLAIARARIDGAKAKAQEAKASLYPNLSFDGYLNRERYTANSYIPPPFGGNYVYQGYVPINAFYDFDFWGKHRQQVAAATSRKAAQQAELAAAQLLLSAEIAGTYYQLRSYVNQLQLTQQLVAKQQLLLNIVKTRTSHNIASDIPVTAAISNLQAAKITMQNQQQGIMILRHQLATLMGKNPLTTQLDVKPFKFVPAQVALPAALPAHLIAVRPDVIASRWQVEASAHEAKVAKARFLPDINLTAFFSYESIGLNLLFNQDSRDILIQPALSLPLFDGGLRRANLSARYAQYDADVEQYNQTLLTALQQVGDAIVRSNTTKKQLLAQNQAVAATHHAFSLVNAQYQHGIVDYSKLISIQTNLLNQQLDQLRMQTQQMQNTIAMIQALGGRLSDDSRG